MASNLTGVFIERKRNATPPIQDIETSIAAFVGVAERGPYDPTLIESFDEFQALYGGYIASNPDLAVAVLGFFVNGGRRCYVKRVVHYTDVTDPDTASATTGTLTLQTEATAATAARVDGTVAEPFALAPDDDVLISIDGAGTRYSVFQAAPASVTGDPGPFALADGDTLQLRLNGGATRTKTFALAEFVNIASATTQEVADAINGLIRNPGTSESGLAFDDGGAIAIETDRRGTSAQLEILGGTAVVKLGLSVGSTLGTGDVADIAEVTAAEVEAVIETPQVFSAAEPFALVDLQTTEFTVDGGGPQTITYNTAQFAAIGAATAEEVAAEINAELVDGEAFAFGGRVYVTTNDPAGSIAVTGGDAAALAFAAAPDIDVIPQVGGTVRLQSTTTGPTSSVQVSAGDVQAAIGVVTAAQVGTDGSPQDTLTVSGRYPGVYTANVEIDVRPASGGDADRFDFVVLEGGVAASSEVFINASMDPADDRYVVSLVNADPLASTGSRLVVLEDEAAAVDDARPAVGTFGPLSGGADGLAGLVDADFLGGESDDGVNTGLRAFDRYVDGLEAPRILAIPGRSSSATVALGMIEYAEVTTNGAMQCILDCPALLTSRQMESYVVSSGLVESSEFAEILWPRITIANPDTGVFGDVATITVPVSGHRAGNYARIDKSFDAGFSKAPAGVGASNNNSQLGQGALLGVVGVETDEVQNRKARERMVGRRVNVVNVRVPQIGAVRRQVYVEDAFTLRSIAGGAIFPTIPANRTAIVIEQSGKVGLQSLVWLDNTDETRDVAGQSMRAFMDRLRLKGVFDSRDEGVFTVDTSRSVNTPDVIAQEKLIVALAWTPKGYVRQVFIQVSGQVSGG